MAKNKSKHRNPLDNNGLYTGRFWQSAGLNDQTLWFYQDWLYQLSCSRFEWQGLPTEIDERYLELTINGRGLALFFKETENYDAYFATAATPSGNINIYQNPLGYMAYGSNGWSKRLKADECVPIWNNYTRVPSTVTLDLFAQRLANIDRTIAVNLANQRHPVLVTCDESQRLTVENIMKQAYGGEPYVIGDNLSLNKIELGYLKSDVPYIADKLIRDKAKIWAEVMLYMGIDNSPVDKAERVQSAEVESNDSQIEKSACIALDCRRYACEEINRKYGLKVWVDMKTDWSSKNFAALMALPSELIEGELHDR